MTRFRLIVPLVVLLTLVAATRWPLAPKYLYYFDSANFALALQDFNPALHRPQPPGYPLFVGLTRVLYLAVPRSRDVFLVAGILAAAAALLLIRSLASSMFGHPAGLLAATLLIFNPAFWLSGITNQVRLFLAAGSLAVALAVWHALQPAVNARWLYAAFGILGLYGGFRTFGAALMMPLVLWAWFRTDRTWGKLTACTLILAATSATWFIPTVVESGGLRSWIGLLWSYSETQFQGSSLVFGAPAPSAWRMVLSAAVWVGLGILSWFWALPWLLWSRVLPDGSTIRLQTQFLALWFLPSFLFSAIIHIGDPDQALGSIPVVCLVGAAALARFAGSGRRLAWTAASAAAINAILFFIPPGGLASSASYRAVAPVDRETAGAVDSLRAIRRAGPIAIIHYGAWVSWRQISYYFPDDPLILLAPSSAGDPSLILGYDMQPLQRSGDAIELPASATIVCLTPFADRLSGRWQRFGTVYYATAPVAVGRHRVTLHGASASP